MNGYVVCIGGANVDILGKSSKNMVPRDSNPGRIRFSVGGVARNIAENLARMELRTELICGLGTGAEGDLVRNRCREVGIGTGYIINAGSDATSSYMALSDEEGDMAWAVSDMSAAAAVTPAALEERRELLRSASLIVADTNIPAGSLAALPKLCPDVPLYVDPVSTVKASKLRHILPGIHTLKLNRMEARTLVTNGAESAAEAPELAAFLRDRGVGRVVITLGTDGVYSSSDDYQGFHRIRRTDMVNATGAGDAFFAGLVLGDVLGAGPGMTIGYAAAAAAASVMSESAVNPEISRGMLENLLQT